jgi:hypothetical protein
LSLSDFWWLVSRRAMILVVMAIILYQLTGIVYKILTFQLVRMWPVSVMAEKTFTAAIPVHEPADAYQIIVKKNPFRTTTKAVAEKQTAAEELQPQNAGLLIDLKGTVAGVGGHGFAVIEEKGTRKQRLVKVGDLIAGAKVVQIKRNTINLLVNDCERTFMMLETKEGPKVPSIPEVTPVRPVMSGKAVMSRSVGVIDEPLED